MFDIDRASLCVSSLERIHKLRGQLQRLPKCKFRDMLELTLNDMIELRPLNKETLATIKTSGDSLSSILTTEGYQDLIARLETPFAEEPRRRQRVNRDISARSR